MLEKIFKYLLISLSVCIYIYLALLHSNTFNKDVNYPDQKPYIDAAIKIRTENFWYMGDRNRMPVYPHLMSFFYNPNMSINDYFSLGKVINILLSLLCILVIYKVTSKYIKGINLAVFLAVSAFTLLVLKAGYFQVEDLFYTLYFICFIMFISTIKSPSLNKGLLVGVITAVTYLTKATISLGFLIFLGFLLYRIFWNAYKKEKAKAKLYLTALVSSVVVFLLVLLPYISQNKKIYGKYFYNVNTTFYVWYDSIDDVYKGTAIHGDTIGWPDLPKDEIPGLSKYLKNHPAGSILNRFEMGFFRMVLFTIWTYAVIPLSFFIFYSLFLIYFAYLKRKVFINLLIKNYQLVLFLSIYLIGHLLAFSWYAVIDSGPRFVLTLYLPAIFIFSLTLQKIAGNQKNYLLYFNMLLLILLAVSIKISVIPILRSIYVGF